jgi:hypothetical protein
MIEKDADIQERSDDDRQLADRVHQHPDCSCGDLSGSFPCWACFNAGRAELPIEYHSERPRRHADTPA